MPDPDHRLRVVDAMPAWLIRTTAVCACVLVIALTVWLASALAVRLTVVVVPVLLAMLLTAVLHPIAARLHHERLPDWVGPIVCVLAVLAILVATFAVTGTRVAEQIPKLAEQASQLREQINSSTGLSIPPIPQPGGSSAASSSSASGGGGSSSGARQAATKALGLATEILVGLFLTLALAFLFLKDGERMWRWLLDHTGARLRNDVDVAGRAAWSTLATYVRGLTVVALFDATAIGIGLLVLGVPLVLTLVVLQFLGSYIPTFGAFVAGAVAVGVALVSGGLATAGLTLLLIVAVQQIGNDVIEPWIMGRTLPLHPTIVLVAVTTGAVLWGIAGALLFVPLAAAGAAAAHAVRTSEAGAEATRG